MPGRTFLRRPLSDVAAALSADDRGLDDPPRSNIAPGQEVVVCAPDRGLQRMRWGMIPVGRVNARGRPVMETMINARSETVFTKTAFDGVRRCLVPTDGWYEWTGQARKKTAWAIARTSGALCVFAGIFDVWRAPNGLEIPQVATLTCEPNGDVRAIHHRMGVILEPEDFSLWLSGSQDAAAKLMRPLPEGVLTVQKAVGVDWDGP